MTLEPLFITSPAIQIHVTTIAVAVIATLLILTSRKGTNLHRTLGWIWVSCMMTTAIVTFWIGQSDAPLGLSPIHLFSVLTLISVPRSILAIRRGNVAAHRSAMIGVVIGGLGLAGFLAFLPGRLMWSIVFGA